MYEVEIEGHFDASHQLPDVGGKCARLHGHTWFVTAKYAGVCLRSNGILADFRDLKSDLNYVLDKYDHQHLNDVLGPGVPSTAEILANEIYRQLASKVLKGGGYWLVEVTVQEGTGGKATYGK